MLGLFWVLGIQKEQPLAAQGQERPLRTWRLRVLHGCQSPGGMGRGRGQAPGPESRSGKLALAGGTHTWPSMGEPPREEAGAPLRPALAHLRVVLAPGLDADEQAQAVPGVQRPPSRLLRQGCGEARAVVTGRREPSRRGAPLPAPGPGLTHVQRGGERVEAGDGRRVLAAGQVQAGAAAEGALGVGLRAHGRSPRAPRALPGRPGRGPRLTT